MKERFDAIFFDNDGILVDTEPLFLQATKEILATVGVDLSTEVYHDLTMRQGRTVFEMVSAKGISDEQILEMRAVREVRYADLIRAGISVLDGVKETVAALEGVRRTAIVTSSGRMHFELIHEQTGLLPYFEFVLADGDYTHHKPHPEPYELAAERMGVDPSRCLVIEDTERGLTSATEAGMACVVIPNELTEGADFPGALARLDSMHELGPLLGIEVRSVI